MGCSSQGAEPQVRTRGLHLLIRPHLLHKGNCSLQRAIPVTAVERSPSSKGDVPHSLAPAHHWSGLVSRHSLKASNKGGLAVSLQPGPNAAFITNHGSNAFCLQKWEYISKKTTDLLEHLYEHQTLNPFSKMAEINPIQHDIRKVKKMKCDCEISGGYLVTTKTNTDHLKGFECCWCQSLAQLRKFCSLSFHTTMYLEFQVPSFLSWQKWLLRWFLRSGNRFLPLN